MWPTQTITTTTIIITRIQTISWIQTQDTVLYIVRENLQDEQQNYIVIAAKLYINLYPKNIKLPVKILYYLMFVRFVDVRANVGKLYS